MIAIETKNITKKYGNKLAVNNVSLQVQRGEFFALLGVNGAGKSTLIQMLSCLTSITSGGAYILGHDVMKEPEKVKK